MGERLAIEDDPRSLSIGRVARYHLNAGRTLEGVRMTMSIDDPEVDRLVHALAQRTEETTTQVVVNALRERLAREEGRAQEIEQVVEEAMAIGQHCAAFGGPRFASSR